LLNLNNTLCKRHIARLAVGLGMSRRRRFARRQRNRRAVTTGNVKNLVLMIRWRDSPYLPRTPTTPGLPTVQVWMGAKLPGRFFVIGKGSPACPRVVVRPAHRPGMDGCETARAFFCYWKGKPGLPTCGSEACPPSRCGWVRNCQGGFCYWKGKPGLSTCGSDYFWYRKRP
jgi:hypothetical protein